MGSHHTHSHGHAAARPASAGRMAVTATLHCLTGCAIGEVLGMAIGTALGWTAAATVALAVGLAFTFGLGLTMWSLRRAGLALAAAVPLAFASDSISIAVMEIVDNAVILTVPGAMEAGLAAPLFWWALAGALAAAFVTTVPVNRALIVRGQGHALVHTAHGHAATTGAARRSSILLGVAAIAVTLAVTVTGAIFLDHEEAPPAGHEEPTQHTPV